jgi:hypothetical protein
VNMRKKCSEQILYIATEHFRFDDQSLKKPVDGEQIRSTIASELAEQTTLSQTRIAEVLNSERISLLPNEGDSSAKSRVSGTFHPCDVLEPSVFIRLHRCVSF